MGWDGRDMLHLAHSLAMSYMNAYIAHAIMGDRHRHRCQSERERGYFPL